METRYLRSFLVLAEELHFGRAARRMNMTQPTLSNQIRSLEREIGDSLFVRDNRNVELSRVGAEFVAHAAGVIASYDRGLSAARRSARQSSGSLTIGYTTAAFIRYVSPTVRRFRQRHPDIDLSLLELSTNEQIAALNDGALDLAFLHPPLASNTHELLDLEPEPLFLAAPAEQVDTRKPDAWTLIKENPLIIFPRERGPHLFDRIMGACAEAGITPAVELDVLPWTSAINLVSSGAGVAFVPKSLRCHKPAGVRFVVVGEPKIELPYAVCLPTRPHSDAAGTFLSELRPVPNKTL